MNFECFATGEAEGLKTKDARQKITDRNTSLPLCGDREKTIIQLCGQVNRTEAR